MPAGPRISIIIPVLNESDSINGLISHLLSLDNSKQTETIVVDGDQDGGTLKAIMDMEVIKIKSPQGRGQQMNVGAEAARGQLLLFLHADTELPRNAFTLIQSAMEEPRFVAGAFDLGIRSERLVFSIIESISSMRSRITRIPFGDRAIFVRKNYFDTIDDLRALFSNCAKTAFAGSETMKYLRKKRGNCYEQV